MPGVPVPFWSSVCGVTYERVEVPGRRSRSYLWLRRNLDLLVLIGYVDEREEIYSLLCSIAAPFLD